MTDDDRYKLIGQWQRHEDAKRLKNGTARFYPFTDTTGHVTLGWGRNISDRGISRDEADYLLENDIEDIESDLSRVFQWYAPLDSVRQAAMVELGAIGLTKLLTFKKFLFAMAHGQYGLASDELYDSNLPKKGQWGPARTAEVAAMIRTGQWQA